MMDLADDVAYSVHDIEDGVVGGRVDLDPYRPPGVLADGAQLVRPRRPPTTSSTRPWTSWPRGRQLAAHAVRRDAAGRAALKNLTSDLIGRFCGAVQQATFARGDGPSCATAPTWSSRRDAAEMAVLKGIAAHYVMRAADRVALMERQRELSPAGRAAASTAPTDLEPAFPDDWLAAPDDAARRRVVVDQVASLTDTAPWPGTSGGSPAPETPGAARSGEVALGVGVVLAGGAVGVQLFLERRRGRGTAEGRVVGGREAAAPAAAMTLSLTTGPAPSRCRRPWRRADRSAGRP